MTFTGAATRRRLIGGLLSATAMVGPAPATVAQTTTQGAPAGTSTTQSTPSGATPPTLQNPETTAPQGPGAGTPQGADGTVDGGDIVVTGYRESIEASLQQQREANAFVNVITAQDVGKFPDRNVADALQRVPGVVISRDGGEGSRVSIRGLQSGLTLTLLNGNFIAGADSGDPQRSFNYVLLPTNFIGSVETFKSPEARIEEGGVGGTVIVNTRRPFDLPAWSGSVTAEGTYADTTEKVNPQLSGQVSWKNEDQTLGLLVGATYQERNVRELRGGTETWRWWSDRAPGTNAILTPATDVDGNTYSNNAAISYWPGQGTTTQSGQHYTGYWAPQAVTTEVFQQKRNRLGIQATAQAKPFEDFVVTANYFRFQYSSDFVSNQLAIPEWGYGDFFNGATLDPSGTIFQSATFQVPPAGTGCLTRTPPCTMETPQIRGSYSREKQISNTFEVEGAWRKDQFDVVFKLGKTRAEGGPSLRFNMAAKPRLTVPGQERNGNFLSRWSFDNNQLNMEFSPELQDNIRNGAAQIDVGSTGSSFTTSSLEQRYAQYDVTYRTETFLDSVQAGIKWRDLRIARDTGRIEWYANPATQQRYQDTPAGAVARPEFFYDKPIDNITGGFKANLVPGIDFNRVLNYLNTTYGDPTKVDENGFQYFLGERVWAAYFQANFKTDRFRGNLGVRVAQTRQTGTTSDRLQILNDYCTNGPGGPLDPNRPLGPDGNCSVLPLSVRETIVNTSVDQSRTYMDVLPSANAAFDITDTLLLRGAVAKVISRPAFQNLGQQRSLTFRSDAYAFDRAQFGEFAGWSGSGGNLDLQPFSAWQYDLGLEWYFQRGSIVGATLFRKDVKDFIVPLVIDVVQTVQGNNVLIQPYSTNANGSSAVTQGVEVFAQHTLPFGLGAQANFTYNDTSTSVITLNGQNVGSSPLVGSAKTQVNGSIFFENDRMLLRASYNRRGRIVGGLSSGLTVYTAPYEQVDLNASFKLMEGLNLTGSVINLTKSESRTYLGNDTEARFGSNNYFGRIAFLGLSYNF
ncbi:TonB-dependent receptor [Sphingomonas sp. Leaf343]|uniref:TonB-dependent receptor n=1 Tax=Sphingomonas sp. Leaf343 TaxID=1736345 RepID=UPI0006F1CE28|nr:TonB-dependent receptor [Sphingomonas sp. Leaf343]KQR82326.1 TonB-dependent receptor [Sphingomonas sp. Leaf343]